MQELILSFPLKQRHHINLIFLLGPCNFNEQDLLTKYSVEQWVGIKVIKETAFEQLSVYIYIGALQMKEN